MKNDRGNKTRRRKVALIAREKNLKSYNTILSSGLNIDGSPLTDEQKASWQAAIDRTANEIAIIQSHIGAHHG
jgi:hypothetical protein